MLITSEESPSFISENCVHRSKRPEPIIYTYTRTQRHSMPKKNHTCIIILLDQWSDNLPFCTNVWLVCWSGGFVLLFNLIVLHWHFVSASFEGILPIHCLATSFLKVYYMLTIIMILLFICLKGNTHGDLKTNDWLNICNAKLIPTKNQMLMSNPVRSLLLLNGESWVFQNARFSCHTRIL